MTPLDSVVVFPLLFLAKEEERFYSNKPAVGGKRHQIWVRGMLHKEGHTKWQQTCVKSLESKA